MNDYNTTTLVWPYKQSKEKSGVAVLGEWPKRQRYVLTLFVRLTAVGAHQRWGVSPNNDLLLIFNKNDNTRFYIVIFKI